MKPQPLPPGIGAEDEISGLIATLHETERRLVQLTGGEVDTVSSESGRPFLLRHAQEELRSSESVKQAAILNALPAHIALLDTAGVVVSVNEAWRQFATANFLQGPEFGVGSNYLALCDAARGNDSAEASAAAAGIRAVLAGAKHFALEYPCHSPTEPRWFLMTVTPLLEGSVRGAVVMHLDITARKRAENAARDSETTMAAAQRIGHFGSWEADLDAEGSDEAHIQRWSDEMFRIAGFEPGAFEITTGFFYSRLPPGDQELVRRAVAVAIRDHQPYSLVHRLIRADGEIRIVHELAKISYDEKTGRPVKIVGTAHDITERTKADAVERENEQWLRAVFDQGVIGVVQTEAKTGRFLRVNQRFCDLVGYTHQEIERLTFKDITHPQDLDLNLAQAARLHDGTEREFVHEKRYVRKDGSSVWANVAVSSIGPPGEVPVFFVAFVQDISERKRFDEHFLQAQKMEALGQFSGGVAHDFNNILATISGYTELSRMILTDNLEVQAHLDGILKASARAADLVKQILTFSRQQPQERHTIQLRPVVEESCKLLRATLPATIVLDAVIGADAPTVLANANQINQVLMNLGINAWHAMGDQPGRLQITLENCVVDAAGAAAPLRIHAGRYARISVRDTGSGMSAATLRRIFDPFFTTKPVGKGTGLGLAVVHGIIDGHDGGMTVESQEGKGTVFHLYFPAHLGVEAVAAIAEGPALRGNGEAVLVVDDEDVIASLLQQTLVQLGYAAEFVTDPAAALARVRSEPQRFKLVLSDQTMPGMTGIGLATRLREICPALPVVLMTGFSAALSPEALQQAGVRQVLLKPMSVHRLASAIHSLLSAASSQ